MSPVLPPCETMWSVSDENASVRGRSGPDKGLPAIGASALAGREGRLRACMRDVQWFLLAFISSQVLNCQLLNRGGPFGVPVQWLTTRGLRANGTKTYVKEIIRCLYLNLELSALLLKYPLAV